MRTSELLHYAFRANDPHRLAHFYADLFEAPFFLHPVMTPLGILMVKLNHPEAIFHGLLEFWPWDVVWDGHACVFRTKTGKNRCQFIIDNKPVSVQINRCQFIIDMPTSIMN
jgi:hypothetical protein